MFISGGSRAPAPSRGPRLCGRPTLARAGRAPWQRTLSRAGAPAGPPAGAAAGVATARTDSESGRTPRQRRSRKAKRLVSSVEKSWRGNQGSRLSGGAEGSRRKTAMFTHTQSVPVTNNNLLTNTQRSSRSLSRCRSRSRRSGAAAIGAGAERQDPQRHKKPERHKDPQRHKKPERHKRPERCRAAAQEAQAHVHARPPALRAAGAHAGRGDVVVGGIDQGAATQAAAGRGGAESGASSAQPAARWRGPGRPHDADGDGVLHFDVPRCAAPQRRRPAGGGRGSRRARQRRRRSSLRVR